MSDQQVRIIRPSDSPFGLFARGVQLLIHYRGLLWIMTSTRVKTRYRQSILGWLWAVVQPVALTALYSFAFSGSSRYSSTPTPYLIFVLAGLTPWVFCSTAITTASGGMIAHHSLMAKVYFPREIVPLSYVLAAILDLSINFGILLVFMSYYGVPITASMAQAIPIILVLVVFVIAICLAISALQVRVRDVSVALPLVMQFLIFTTPVVYPISAIPSQFRPAYMLNPLAILVDGFRGAMIEGKYLEISRFLYCLFVAVICLAGSYLYFKAVEPTLVDNI